MAEIKVLIEFFLLSMAFGVGVFTPLANTQMTGVGLLKLLTTVTGVSLLLGLSLNLSYTPLMSAQPLLMAISLVCMVFVYLFHKDKKSSLMWALYLVQNISLFLTLNLFMNQTPFLLAYGLSSVFFLGIIIYAMLLGHWYLVTPKLSVDPLKRALWVTWVVLVIKLAFLTYSLSTDFRFFTEGSTQGAGYMFNWIMLSMRVLWGYVIIFVMSVFTWKLVCMRSTQSATGILYAMTFFVLVGELIGNYMYFSYGMFL